ncbi:hypothetical protein GDO78_012718 [Eleutherodactylus coqui]|uniref:Membrane bound O-acyltransferase domain containing 1 n=1 Tax=Eleutherodactylus coqui TaxID=57060 RepID=A0A8J6F2I5_ELECQ|nr:hypothetical protein GDO78_012718 [Eleutherodactylus coqui]
MTYSLTTVHFLFSVWLSQVNFVACQLFALVTAVWFRTYLSPRKSHATIRHGIATIIGVYLAVFCFGWYSLHIFSLVSLSYCIMMYTSTEKVHSCSFILALGYLTLCQINRVYIFNYGILTTDFSGPLMIVTQKITTLAFQLHDGNRGKPTFLEYISYHLNFMSILAGPCSNFNEYIEFIEGRHIQSKLLLDKGKRCSPFPDPSPNKAVITKLLICVISLTLFLTVCKVFPLIYMLDDEIMNNTSLLWKILYLNVAVMASKPKYYFAWTLADAINNAAGYGFNGIDENGNFRWDLISNLNIWNVEFATSFKMYIDNWNIQTVAWLKRVCYDRAPKYRTGLTFLLSAVWHGVYPGYYFTFLTAIPVMWAARGMRNVCRHHFIYSKFRKSAYDIITWIVTQMAISYTVAPFFLLATEPTIKFYKSVNFYFHIVVCIVLILLSIKSHHDRRGTFSKKTASPTTNPSNHVNEKQLENVKFHSS